MKKYIEEVSVEKIVPEGKAMSSLSNGKKVFFYGALENEKVSIEIYKNKKDYALANLITIIEENPNRIIPKDKEIFLSTSPFQILNYDYELLIKKQIVKEAFINEHIVFDDSYEFWTDNNDYYYRNKMEYSFYFDKEEEILKLAFFKRGTHYKVPLNTESLAKESITHFALNVLSFLNFAKIDGRKLKTLLVRTNKKDEIKAQLYVKDEDLLKTLNIEDNLEVIYSNPKSPASVITKRNAEKESFLTDNISGIEFTYPVSSFFQINLPVYEKALIDIAKKINDYTNSGIKSIVDFYSGVGTIGLSLFQNNKDIKITFVEINEYACNELNKNIEKNFKGNNNMLEIVNASCDDVLDYIRKDEILIVDPPRAGLSKKVIQKILDEKPKRIIYLSCNPITQARDLRLLCSDYKIIFNKGYNFFPRTVHIENLVVLE